MSRAYASPVGRTRRASCFGISAVHDNGVILEKTRPRVMRTRCLAGFERTHLASRFPHRVRARRRVLDDRLERHLRSGARRLPRRARPTGISVSKTLGARLANAPRRDRTRDSRAVRGTGDRASRAFRAGAASGVGFDSPRASRRGHAGMRGHAKRTTVKHELRAKPTKRRLIGQRSQSAPSLRRSAPNEIGVREKKSKANKYPSTVPHAANVKSRLKMG